MSRDVTDSRGYSYTQRGTIGGDLGGLYYIYFESDTVQVGGKPVRLKHSLRLTAPLSYRLGGVGVGRQRAVHQLRQSLVAQGP